MEMSSSLPFEEAADDEEKRRRLCLWGMILGGTIEGAGASCLLAAEVLIANNGRLRTSLLLAANALMVMVAAKNEPAMAR